jgi:hypothetical protein
VIEKYDTLSFKDNASETLAIRGGLTAKKDADVAERWNLAIDQEELASSGLINRPPHMLDSTIRQRLGNEVRGHELSHGELLDVVLREADVRRRGLVCGVSRARRVMVLDRDDVRRQRIVGRHRIGRAQSHGGWQGVLDYGDGVYIWDIRAIYTVPGRAQSKIVHLTSLRDDDSGQTTNESPPRCHEFHG